MGLPSLLPNPSSNGYVKWGYLRQDSGLIMMPRDTFPAKYPTIILHTNGIYYRTEGNSTHWSEFGNGWNLKGNIGTMPATNFIGTIDSVDLVIKTNNQERVRIAGFGRVNIIKDALVNGLTVGKGNNSIINNTALGLNVLNSSTTGSDNTGVGVNSLSSNTIGDNNTATGLNSLSLNISGFNNSAFGKNVLRSNLTGANNTGVGYEALSSNVTGFGNTAVGFQSLLINDTSGNNTAIGYQTLYANRQGYNNVAVGTQALHANVTGRFNTAIGVFSLDSNTTGESNTAIGAGALDSTSIGGGNTAIGYVSGFRNMTGKNNIFLGNRSGYGIVDGDSGVYIGWNKFLLPSNLTKNVIINDGAGNLAYKKDNVGNITIPVQTLQNDTVSNKPVVQNVSSGDLHTVNWNYGLYTDVSSEVFVSTGASTVTTVHSYVNGSIKLYRLGQRIDPIEITPLTSNSFTLGFTPPAGDRLIMDYKY